MKILIPILVMLVLGFLFGLLISFFSMKFKVEEDTRLTEINDLLPGANCGACGSAFYPLILLIVAPLYSILLEMLCLLIMHKEQIKSFKDLVDLEKTEFGAFPGLFMVLTSPAYTPMWIIIVGISVGEVVGKMLFGGFGQNIFNPGYGASCRRII